MRNQSPDPPRRATAWWKVLLVVLTYLLGLAIVAVVSFILVIFLAGPHAGLLPNWAEHAVLLLGWLAVILLPALAARKIWTRLSSH